MIQIFTLNLAANEAREVAVQGEYFELRDAVYPIALVELLDRSGGVISRLENPEQSDYVKPGRYETIRITNGPTAQTVRHFYGSGDAGSRRTSGLVRIDGTSSVAVVDGEVSRTESGMAYSAVVGIGGVAAQNAYLEIWNPLGSGKRVIVSDLVVSSGSTTTYRLMRIDAAVAVGAGALSKLSGGAVSTSQTSVGTVGAVVGTQLETGYVSGTIPFSRNYKQPYIIMPGSGLAVFINDKGFNMYGSMQFVEEAYP